MLVGFQHEMRGRGGDTADGRQFLAYEHGNFLEIVTFDEQKKIECTRHQVHGRHFRELSDPVSNSVKAAFPFRGDLHFDDGGHPA